MRNNLNPVSMLVGGKINFHERSKSTAGPKILEPIPRHEFKSKKKKTNRSPGEPPSYAKSLVRIVKQNISPNPVFKTIESVSGSMPQLSQETEQLQ